MEPVNIMAALKDLSKCLREIRSLLAWKELAEGEAKPGTPPSFRINHHIEEDVRHQCGFFLKTTMDLHEFLNTDGRKSLSESVQEAVRKKLRRMERRFDKLKLTERFISR